MTAMPRWAWPILYLAYFFRMWTPRRSAIISKTRLRYKFKVLADELSGYTGEEFKSGEGLVVGYEHEYVGPRDWRKRYQGVYARNVKFPKGYIVLPDGGGPLVCVPQEDAELLSGYCHAVPGFTEKADAVRVNDLPFPLVAYPGDTVRLTNDRDDVERAVRRILFTPLGQPVYEVLMTDDEVRLENERREEEVRIHNENRDPDAWEKGYTICEKGEKHAMVRGNEIILIRSKGQSLPHQQE